MLTVKTTLDGHHCTGPAGECSVCCVKSVESCHSQTLHVTTAFICCNNRTITLSLDVAYIIIHVMYHHAR